MKNANSSDVNKFNYALSKLFFLRQITCLLNWHRKKGNIWYLHVKNMWSTDEVDRWTFLKETSLYICNYRSIVGRPSEKKSLLLLLWWNLELCLYRNNCTWKEYPDGIFFFKSVADDDRKFITPRDRLQFTCNNGYSKHEKLVTDSFSSAAVNT